jgi:hypothetical protein
MYSGIKSIPPQEFEFHSEPFIPIWSFHRRPRRPKPSIIGSWSWPASPCLGLSTGHESDAPDQVLPRGSVDFEFQQTDHRVFMSNLGREACSGCRIWILEHNGASTTTNSVYVHADYILDSLRILSRHISPPDGTSLFPSWIRRQCVLCKRSQGNGCPAPCASVDILLIMMLQQNKNNVCTARKHRVSVQVFTPSIGFPNLRKGSYPTAAARTYVTVIDSCGPSTISHPIKHPSIPLFPPT